MSRQTFVISTWFTASLGFCLMKVTYSGVPKKSTVKSYGRWKLGCALRSVWFYIFFLFFCSLLKSMSYGFQKLNVWLKDLFSKATILLQLLLAWSLECLALTRDMKCGNPQQRTVLYLALNALMRCRSLGKRTVKVTRVTAMLRLYYA